MSRILVIAVLTEISMFNNPKYAASHYAIIRSQRIYVLLAMALLSRFTFCKVKW